MNLFINGCLLFFCIMHYYLSLTSGCDLNCKYCAGKSCDDFMSFDEASKYDFDLPVNS